jgi:hypothetical protein
MSEPTAEEKWASMRRIYRQGSASANVEQLVAAINQLGTQVADLAKRVEALEKK